MFLKINPAAQSDLPKLNEIMKSLESYQDGIEFTDAEDIGNNEVRFHYVCPDDLQDTAYTLVQQAKEQFFAERSS